MNDMFNYMSYFQTTAFTVEEMMRKPIFKWEFDRLLTFTFRINFFLNELTASKNTLAKHLYIDEDREFYINLFLSVKKDLEDRLYSHKDKVVDKDKAREEIARLELLPPPMSFKTHYKLEFNRFILEYL